MDRIHGVMASVNERIPAYMKTAPGLLKLWCLVMSTELEERARACAVCHFCVCVCV